MTKLKETINDHFAGLLNSYAMVFFSKNRIFAWILLLVTFFDPVAGLSGLLSVLTANIAARIIGFSHFKIQSGLYGFNALLVGLGVGVYFQLTIQLMILLIFASILTLFITILVEGVSGKYGLPYLTIPFLFAFWVVTLAARYYTELHLSERGIFQLNEIYGLGGSKMLAIFTRIETLPFAPSIATYFKSLSAIFFQYHLFTGILVAIGLLYYSRIAFLLSLIGFYSAYLFYSVIGANFNELNYSYIGFNYILTSIAIGGFFIVSSRNSFFWVILLTPLISILATSTSTMLGILQLSTFSLPFNLTVLLFIYALKFREKHITGLKLVELQEFSPEKNLYSQRNSETRYPAWSYLPVQLPVIGEWIVTQGHSGQHTHREGWRHAWDLEIADDKGNTYAHEGNATSDYFCFNKPVVAPANGWIEEITDNIEDNEIGQVNLTQNWGNTIIIRHSDFLYTKICHLRKGSFKVTKGATVKKGEVLASCGNSGRSPVPHVHFQFQSTPYIGSHTLDYPLSQYLLQLDSGIQLRSLARPKNGDRVSNISVNACLRDAFNLVPGQIMEYDITVNGRQLQAVSWEVFSDIYGYTYIYCAQSKSRAYFRSNDDLFYFTAFEGKRSSLLFAYFIGAYKVAKGYYRNLSINDSYSLNVAGKGLIQVLQDFIAPFYIFIRSGYEMHHESMADELEQRQITLKSAAKTRYFKKDILFGQFEFFIDHGKVERFVVKQNKGTTIATLKNSINISLPGASRFAK